MTRLLTLVAALPLVMSCAARSAPVKQGDQIWVALSSEDSVLPTLREGAAEAGCDVVHHPEGGVAPSLVALCRGERVSMRQSNDWLIYRCTSLSPTKCRALVRSFAPDIDHDRDRSLAGRGSGT